MLTLESYQRGLLDLIKNRGLPQDPFLQKVASSPGIAIVRETAVWWRLLQIESLCPLSSSILKYQGQIREVVTSYFNSNRTSPYAEELSEGFLKFLGNHADPLIRSIATLEYAVLRVRSGLGETEVIFDRNPDQVFLAMKLGGTMPSAEPDSVYRVKVARDLPGMLRCIREAA
jgi:hypothetical protein